MNDAKVIRIAINGFGRIGRLVFRAFLENYQDKNIEIVAVNDLSSIDAVIHLLTYDSVHGKLKAEVSKISESEFCVNGRNVKYTSHKNLQDLNWKQYDVDLVMECTGVFKGRKDCAAHISAGASKVLISAPSDDVDNTIVYGVNHISINKNEDVFVSCASCTTNCLAPIVSVLHGQFGLQSGFVTTVHSYTGDQRLIDTYHSDLRRSRSAAGNIIPTSTGATKAIEKIFPDLKGRLSGIAIRVPTSNVSIVDFTCSLSTNVTVESVNNAIIKGAIP